MNLSFSNHSMQGPREPNLEQSQAALQQSSLERNLYDDSYCGGSVISQLLQKTVQNKRAVKDSLVYLPTPAVSDPGQEDRSSSSSEGSSAEPLSPMSHAFTVASHEADRPLNDHHQAKRARVESIIRGMSGSPNARLPGGGERSEGDNGGTCETFRESKRKRRIPRHRGGSSCGGGRSSKDEECQKLKAQIQAMQMLLLELQQKFIQVCQPCDSKAEDREEGGPAGPQERDNSRRDKELPEGFNKELYLGSNSQSKLRPDRITIGHRQTAMRDSVHLAYNKAEKNLPEVLKYELSRAVSKSVDLVFKNFASVCVQSPLSPVEQSQCHGYVGSETKTLIPSTHELSPNRDDVKSRLLQHYEAEVQMPEDQTEALSLVICKPPLRHCNSVNETLKRPYHTHQVRSQFNRSTSLEENQFVEHLLKHSSHGNLGNLPCLTQELDQAPLDSLTWDTIKVRPTMNSSHVKHQTHPLSLGQVAVSSHCHPHVSMETRNLQEPETTQGEKKQEGLTPNHLKKAKLMFFYTRYPNSNVLKTFFPDIKFNRCITSQLIKWFSNFREFYYIQMEKFARQAVMDGVTSVKELSVTRDSELFRALNMHYNKANDFQVPGRFLEVAEITLQEFFNAISQAKDSDPSWKKAIYKVICKLDSDVPEELKSTVCL